MAKSVFNPIPLQEAGAPAPLLLGTRRSSLALSEDGPALFQIAALDGRGILRLSFEATFTYPLRLLLEAPGEGTYGWNLTGLPNADQDGETAYTSSQVFVTAMEATGEPQLAGPFQCLIPGLGLQASLPESDLGPGGPLTLAGRRWIVRLAAPTGSVRCATMEYLKAA